MAPRRLPDALKPVSCPPEAETRGNTMGKRDDLIATYASDLREKCGVEPDMAC